LVRLLETKTRIYVCCAVTCSHVTGRITEMWIELKVEVT